MKLSILGMGLMGRAIALRLHGLGHQVTVWNRSPTPLPTLVGEGLKRAASPAEAVSVSELSILVVSDARAIREVLFSPPRPDLAGRIIVQMGTIAPQESRELSDLALAAGGAYLEAPVLGSLPEAEQGRLIVMAGGSEELFERCRPVLADLGADPRLIGPVGHGAALKLAMNQLIASLTAGFSLSLGLVRASAIDVAQFMDLLRGSALYAPTFDKKLPRMLEDDYGRPNFPLQHLRKDVRLFRAAAAETGQDQRLLEALEGLLASGCDAGLAGLDYSAVFRVINPPQTSEKRHDDSIQ